MQNYDELDLTYENGFKDSKTAYIQSCLVAPEYRNQMVGERIMEKLLPTAKGHFTDILLTADKKAVTFYQKLGFAASENISADAKKTTEFIMGKRGDNNLIVLMSKSLNNMEPCWQRLVKLIK